MQRHDCLDLGKCHVQQAQDPTYLHFYSDSKCCRAASSSLPMMSEGVPYLFALQFFKVIFKKQSFRHTRESSVNEFDKICDFKNCVNIGLKCVVVIRTNPRFLDCYDVTIRNFVPKASEFFVCWAGQLSSGMACYATYLVLIIML